MPSGSLNGAVRVPSDKSISHRAAILAALAEGKSSITHFLQAEDTLATLQALADLGVSFSLDKSLVIEGVGFDGFKKPKKPLNLGNSGTSARLLMGLLAGQPFVTELHGDGSLSRRPMRRLAEPLMSMGAKVQFKHSDGLPLTILGQKPLSPLTFSMPVASAQIKTALMLAALQAKGQSGIYEEWPTRDHTERLLGAFGVPIIQEEGWCYLTGDSILQPAHVRVPADMSSAAFLMVGAVVSLHSKLHLLEVGVNPTRIGLLQCLQAMGAQISMTNARGWGQEPVADIVVQSSQLQGIEVPIEWARSAIDEIPVLLIAAACADGVTVVRGVAELRHKESDRLHAMAVGLRAMGVAVTEFEDGLQVVGSAKEWAMAGGKVNSFGDHRIAMAFTMAALRAKEPIWVEDTDCIATSFPGFFAMVADLGLCLGASWYGCR